MSELTVILKDSERTLRFKFLMYESYSMSPEDPAIIARIAKARESFPGEPEDITVRSSMEIQ